MTFSRDDLKTYESQPQAQIDKFDPWEAKTSTTQEVVKEPEVTPQTKASEETDIDSAIAASVTDSSDKGENDGSKTTEQEAETVAANTASPESDKDSDLEEPVDGKPRSRAQERIEELVAERNALRKYGEYLLTQVDELRKSPVKSEITSPKVSEIKEDKPPTLEDAKFDPIEFTKLQNDWIQKQVDKRVESAVRQIETKQTEASIRQGFEAKTAEFRKTVPDFDIVIANPALPSLAPEAARVVVKSDNGPAIAYHLGKNPDLATRISRMEPMSQAVAIGRLEEQLIRAQTTKDINTKQESSKTTAPVKTVAVTKAPPPPKPVSGGSAPVAKDIGQMTMEEWVAHERGRKISERQARQKLRQSFR